MLQDPTVTLLTPLDEELLFLAPVVTAFLKQQAAHIAPIKDGRLTILNYTD